MRKACYFVSVIIAFLLLFFGYFFGKRGAVLDSNLEGKLSGICVQKGGRIMPLSSAANDVLRTLYGKSSIKFENGKYASASEWLLWANANPLAAANLKSFKTDNRELQNLLGVKGRYFSYSDFEKIFEKAYESASSKDSSKFSEACQDAIANIAIFEDALCSFGFSLPDSTPLKTYKDWNALVEKCADEITLAKKENRAPNREILLPMFEQLNFFKENFERWNSRKTFNIYAIKNGETYTSVFSMIYEKSQRTEFGEAYYKDLARLLENLKQGDFREFEKNLDSLYEKNPPSFRVKFESFFNRLDIFYRGALLYFVAFLVFLGSFATKKYSEIFKGSGVIFLSFATLAHLFGVGARVFIQMRPPVTNLYSSIIFAGLASAIVGLVFFKIKRDRIYAISSCITGALSIVVALNMPYSGDTMGMMRAVLNSNFWLTIHIVPMMLGYCGVFLAGFVASFRIIANLIFRKGIVENTQNSARGVFYILCFAMTFSFLGTMLGGVWAEVSWGRFWGWDPKENGALMVVLWCAFVVHGYAMKILSHKATLAFSAFGNVVASWAWFGVNIMGVGLHSYGFLSGGIVYLTSFVVLQSLIALLAFLPASKK